MYIFLENWGLGGIFEQYIREYSAATSTFLIIQLAKGLNRQGEGAEEETEGGILRIHCQ